MFLSFRTTWGFDDYYRGMRTTLLAQTRGFVYISGGMSGAAFILLSTPIAFIKNILYPVH
jgi:hypothetical protein